MRKYQSILVFTGLILWSCSSNDKNEELASSLPRVAIAGLAIESSTFSPAQTHAPAFHAQVGNEILDDGYPFFAEGTEVRKRGMTKEGLQRSVRASQGSNVRRKSSASAPPPGHRRRCRHQQ